MNIQFKKSTMFFNWCYWWQGSCSFSIIIHFHACPAVWTLSRERLVINDVTIIIYPCANATTTLALLGFLEGNKYADLNTNFLPFLPSQYVCDVKNYKILEIWKFSLSRHLNPISNWWLSNKFSFFFLNNDYILCFFLNFPFSDSL